VTEPDAAPGTVRAAEAAGRGDAAGPGRRRGRRGAGGSAATVVLAGALAVTLMLVALLGLKVRHHHQLDSARQSAIATARGYAVDLTTYDHTHLDADFNKVLNNSTGTFRAQYTAASEQLRELIAKFQANATGKVLETALVSCDTHHATLLLFVDQTVTNTNSKEPKIDRSRMKMSLEKHGGAWLISSLDLL
jgi:Mce-associated membrane protein